jgi:RNA polymerase-binding transcription factor DksA
MSEQTVVSDEETRLLADTLRGRLRDLTDRVDRIEAQSREPLDDDSEDRAVEREDEESSDALERVCLGEIAAIETALSRIEAGTYGRCLACGEPIGLPRLRIVPETARCMPCAAASWKADRRKC